MKGIKDNLIKQRTKKKKSLRIVVYGENWCPFCKKVKTMAKKMTNDFQFISGKSGSELKRILKLKSIPRTIPLVVVNNKYIGGYSNLQTFKK